MSLIGQADTPLSYVADYMQATVGMFGIPAGGFTADIEAFGAATNWNVDLLYAALLNSTIGRSIYTPGASNTTLATKLIDKLGGSLLSDANKAAVIDLAKSMLDGGTSLASVAMTFVEAVSNIDTTDADYGAVALQFANRIEIANYYTFSTSSPSSNLSALIAVLSSVNDTTDVSNPEQYLNNTNVTTGQTFTLTTSATDVVNGTSGSDTIIGQLGQTTTLQSSDTINGQAGSTDTLRVVTDGTAAQSATGFTTSGVEVLEVQAQAAGGTTLSLENVTGLATVRSYSTSADLTVNQVKNIVGLEVQGALNAANLTVNYQAAAVSGTADTQHLTLNGNALGNVTVNGIETMAVSTSNAASTVTSLVGNAFAKLTASGDQSLTITNALAATVKTVDASAMTAGGLNVTLTNAADVAVTGGAGADSVVFTGALTSADSFNGGDGRDTITANLAEYTGSTYAVASKISHVETMVIADTLTGAFDASKFTGDDTIQTNVAYTTGASITGMESGYTLNIRGNNAGKSLTAAITSATSPNTDDVLNIKLGTPTTAISTDGAGNAGTINVTGIETINITANGTLATGTDAVVLNDTTATTASLAKVTITGANGVTVSSSNTGAASVTTVDASAATGNVNMSGVAIKSTGGTLTGGSGADTISGGTGADTVIAGAGNDTVNGTTGADNITLGDGADTVVYTAATQSTTNSGVDIINDFVSGTDKFDISALLSTTPGSFKGNQATFSASQNSVVAGDGVLDVVYQQDEKVLWIDMNDDGLLNAADFRISMPNTTSLTAADVGLNTSGNSITLSAAAAVVNTTTNTNATAKSTVYADSISSTIANLVGSTVDGAAGTDVLTLTDAGAVGAMPAGLTNIETLVLATVGTTANTGVAFNDAGIFANVTGSSNADTIASTADLREGGTINLGAGNDVITALALFETTAGADSSYKFNIDMGAGDDTVTTTTATTFTSDSVLAGGEGTDILNVATGSNIAAGSLTGFETLNAAGTLSLTLAQLTSFTNFDTVGVADTLTLTTAGTFSTTALAGAGGVGVDTYVLANGTNNVTTGGVAAANQTITGGTGADTLNTTVANGVQHTFTGAGGTDVLNITGGMTGALTVTTAGAGAAALGATGLETINISGASTANALTLVSAVGGDFATINASGVTGGGITIVTTGLTAATDRTITLTSGNDTITNLTGTANTLTVDFGTGVTDTVSDLAVASTGLFTIKAGATSGSTHTINFAATTANLATGSATGTLIDFSGDVSGIVVRAIGAAGVNTANQVIIDNTTAAADTDILWDVDGSGTFTTGDVKIHIVGQAYTGGTAAIVNGNLQL